MHLTSIYAISYQSIFKIISRIIKLSIDLSSFLPRNDCYFKAVFLEILVK